MNSVKKTATKILAQSVGEKNIILDRELFKKTAKRLQRNINELPLTSNTNASQTYSISDIQEVLSKSLGFRNYDAINHYFGNSEQNFEFSRKFSFLESWKADDITALFIFLLGEDASDMWKSRAISLIYTTILALTHMRDENEIILNSRIIREYLMLDNSLHLYKTRRDFPDHIKASLRSYFLSLPGFEENAPKQNDTVIEQHGFLQMYFSNILNVLDRIEVGDPVIISPNWFEAHYSINNSDQQTIGKTKSILDIDSLNNLYEKIDMDDWQAFCGPLRKTIMYPGKKDEIIQLEQISLIKPIKYNAFYENSWLCDESFKKVLNSLFSTKQFKTFYLSDLLSYSFKIVNKQKRAIYLECVNNLLANYSSVVEYSEIFCKLAKKNESVR